MREAHGGALQSMSMESCSQGFYAVLAISKRYRPPIALQQKIVEVARLSTRWMLGYIRHMMQSVFLL